MNPTAAQKTRYSSGAVLLPFWLSAASFLQGSAVPPGDRVLQ
jgi:hypothetical protein